MHYLAIVNVFNFEKMGVCFRTAAGTAYPQPAPGTAAAPGPVANLPADKLLSTLAYRQVSISGGKIALSDKMLG